MGTQSRHWQTERKELLDIIAKLEARVAALEKRNAELEAELAKARKNSSNSSKPPSSDIVRPKKDPPSTTGGKRKQGGQPGHSKHQRPDFTPEEINNHEDHALPTCPNCGGDDLVKTELPPRALVQVDISETPTEVTEHHCWAYFCFTCRKVHYASLPPVIRKGGLVGPRLTALIAYMKGACHASFSTIRKYLRDVVGVAISRGQLRKVVGKVADALEQPWLELIESLRREAVLNVDETGHKDNGDLFWTWCFRARDYTCFKIDSSRGSKVLKDVLGEEFAGVMGCDYFSAYRKYMKDFNVLLQFCLAHLIRDLKFLITYPEKSTRAYGQRVLEAIRGMFALIHRRDQLDETTFQAKLIEFREKILKAATEDAPDKCHVRPIVKRFRDHGEAYFRFITTPGLEPTNNLAEQAIRFVVIDRVITQGTRSEGGRKWCERIWSVIATCTAQGRSAFDFILEAVRAHFAGNPAPSLLNST